MPRAKKKISEAHWEMIVSRIHDRSCIPFLGAGVNVTHKDYAGLPLGGDVALQLIGRLAKTDIKCESDLAEVTIKPVLKKAKLDRDLARIMVTNLPRVALHVLHEYDWPFFRDEVLRKILNDRNCEPSPLLKTLARLPFSLIVTTNYDALLEKAIDEAMPEWWRLQSSEVLDPRLLVSGLKTPASKLATAIRERLSAALRGKIDASAGTVPAALLSTLCREIDALLPTQILAAAVIAAERYPSRLIDLSRARDAQLTRLNRWMIEESFPSAIARSRKSYEVIVQPTKGFASHEIGRHIDGSSPHEALVVYKIHGSFSNTKEQDILITEEDYVDFLTVVTTDRGVPAKIESRMSAGSLLFLGYGLEDWDFRTIYKGLIEGRPKSFQRKSFAIQKSPPEFWVDLWAKKEVVIYDYDVYEFAEELERRYMKEYGSLTAVSS